MEKENITGLLLKAIDLFSSLYSLLPRIEGGSYDLGPDEAIEEEWEEVGPGLDSIIGDDENLVKLIEYLKAERNAGHSIDPQIQELREWLWRAVTLVPGVNKATITGLTNHSDKYCNWLDWINRYYPPEQSKQEPFKERDTDADERFASQELQEVKQELVKVGLIKDGKWSAGTANFECLVKEFKGVFGIETKKGDLDRKSCAAFVGFDGSLDSARSSTNHEQQSPKAKSIKAICREIHTKYVK
jgi:hypothetical protein